MKPPAEPSTPGFTLLELMLSVAVFLLLMTAAFSLVGATSELMTEVSESQNASAVRIRFVEVCRTAFENTTDISSLEFRYEERSKGTDTFLSLVNTPSAFDFGVNLQDEIDRVVIAAEIRPDGFIRSGIYYMTALDFEEAQQNSFERIQAPYIELVPRMRQLTWRFYNARTREWEPTLDGGIDPSLVELTIQIEGDAAPLRSVFFFVGKGGDSDFPVRRSGSETTEDENSDDESDDP